MLETLSQLMLNRNFMVDLWINFDCDPESEDVFERMIEFLTKVSFRRRFKWYMRLICRIYIRRVCILPAWERFQVTTPTIWTTANFCASRASFRLWK